MARLRLQCRKSLCSVCSLNQLVVFTSTHTHPFVSFSRLLAETEWLTDPGAARNSGTPRGARSYRTKGNKWDAVVAQRERGC